MIDNMKGEGASVFLNDSDEENPEEVAAVADEEVAEEDVAVADEE